MEVHKIPNKMVLFADVGINVISNKFKFRKFEAACYAFTVVRKYLRNPLMRGEIQNLQTCRSFFK